MGTPQPGYQYHNQPGQDPNQQAYYDGQQDGPQAASPVQGGPPVQHGGGRRKRNYAGQAYDFGGGANSALGGQQQGGGAYPAPPGAGYGQPLPQPGQQQPSYGSGPTSPAFGAPNVYGQQQPAVGGYQPPDPSYPTHGAPPGQPGVAGITQGMGNMAMGGQVQHQPPPAQGRQAMNQLYPTDLLNQPLNVAELDLPPPPIILPPNVSADDLSPRGVLTKGYSLVLLLPQMPTVRPSTFVPRSMLSQLHILCSRSLGFRSPWSYNPIAHFMIMKTLFQWFLIKS